MAWVKDNPGEGSFTCSNSWCSIGSCVCCYWCSVTVSWVSEGVSETVVWEAMWGNSNGATLLTLRCFFLSWGSCVGSSQELKVGSFSSSDLRCILNWLRCNSGVHRGNWCNSIIDWSNWELKISCWSNWQIVGVDLESINSSSVGDLYSLSLWVDVVV